MKRKIEDLTIFEMVRFCFLKFGISVGVLETKVTFYSDKRFLLKDITVSLDSLENHGDLSELIESINFSKLITDFLLEVAIEEAVLADGYIYKVKCLGSNKSWVSSCFYKSCLMAIVYWYSNDKKIEDLDQLTSKPLESNVFIESLGLPIILTLKLKKMNVKTTSDLKKISDLDLLAELNSHLKY